MVRKRGKEDSISYKYFVCTSMVEYFGVKLYIHLAMLLKDIFAKRKTIP